MGQQSITGAVTMKCFAVLALALATASAIHIPAKYAHYKPGYMRIPGWEKIASGERKLNQKAPTMKFTPRDEIDTRATCGTPGPMVLDDFEKIVGGVEATPHQFPWQVGLFFDGYFCGGSIISSKYILTAAHCADGVYHHEVVIGAHEIRDPANKIIDAYSPTVHPEWDSYNLANGDSGGPLSIPGAQYEQIGIVSFGSTLGCESGAPAGFTEVTMYRDWISSVTGIKV